MYLKSKVLVFLTSLIVIASMITLSGFATDSFGGKPGISSPSEYIELDKPGKYILIGVHKLAPSNMDKNFTNTDGNISVYTNSQIVIGGNGKYDITMKDVTIDLSNIDKLCPFKVAKRSNVDLTLVGKNTLKSKDSIGIAARKSNLTITKASEGASLEVSGKSSGIEGYNLTINGGEITASGGMKGIIGVNNLTINGGEITASGEIEGISGGNVRINGGEITAKNMQEIYVVGFGICASENIQINDGTIRAYGYMAIHARDVTINGGEITASGEIEGISGGNVIINGGEITATGESTKLDGKIINGIHSYEAFNITGGTINGEEYPLEASSSERVALGESSVASYQAAFDKELSDDTASSVATSEKTTTSTGWFKENKLLLICISLGLIAIAAVVIYRKKSA